MNDSPVARRQSRILTLGLVLIAAFWMAGAAHGIDLVNLASIGGPLGTALTMIGSMTPGLKALVAIIGFLVTVFSLIALRQFGPVVFYIGLIIFLVVALPIAGQMLGATI